MLPKVPGGKGVFDARGLMPTKVSCHPGVPPVPHVPSDRDVGPIEEARVLFLEEVANLLSFKGRMPSESKSRVQNWLANSLPNP